MARHISVYGDSISTFEGYMPDGYATFYRDERLGQTGVLDVGDTWWMKVIDALGGEFLANASWSGSMVEGVGFPAGNCDERVESLSRDGFEPDDVLVYFGTNDYGWGSADAQAAGRASATPFVLAESGSLPPVTEAGLAPADAVARFGVAYFEMVMRIRLRYPAARIWCIGIAPGRVRGAEASTFPRAYRGALFANYNAAIATAADAWGGRFCDLDACGYDYEGVEGTHPTALGMRQLAWLVLRSMQGLGECTLADLGDYPGGASFVSSDPCDCPGRACVGCEHALATGNSWMHVCLRRQRG
ncbi:MAG: SGNH/GDSL hydrolase family protein [Eggerthellaceae bacterium]|nr:SGNH/GDSL hydrolase family protein [Eggerthellaceae bacterium]